MLLMCFLVFHRVNYPPSMRQGNDALLGIWSERRHLTSLTLHTSFIVLEIIPLPYDLGCSLLMSQLPEKIMYTHSYHVPL